MRIDPRVASVQLATAGQSTQRVGSQRFSLRDDGAARTASTRSSTTLASLDAILALQAEEDPAERRQRSARRGKSILDALDALKASLLAGQVSADDLGRLSRGLQSAGGSGDPGLDQVVGEIELRAKVELAKLGRSDLG